MIADEVEFTAVNVEEEDRFETHIKYEGFVHLKLCSRDN
jgi:hypothetical protein